MNVLVEILVPLIVFTSLLILVGLALHYQIKSKEIKSKNIHKALEEMDSIDSKVIEALQDNTPTKEKDLRRGIILLAIALAIAVFSQLLSIFKRSDIPDAVLGLSAFPAMLGIAFICFALFNKK